MNNYFKPFKKMIGETVIGNFEYNRKILYYAQRKNGASILMDVLAEDIPDGQTAYMFDNKLIITVHWKDFKSEDENNIYSDIKLRMAPFFEWGLTFWVKFGSYKWGDILTMPGLLSSFNAEKTFTEVVFLFVDSTNGQPIAIRVMPLNNKIGNLIYNGNYVSYEYFHRSGKCRQSYQKTEIPLLFSDWLNSLPIDDRRTITKLDYESMENDKTFMAGIDMDSNNNVSFYFNEG